MTTITLPIRVDIKTGAKLPPRGDDLRALPWVQGAAETLSQADQLKYREQRLDLGEKLKVLRSKRVQAQGRRLVAGPVPTVEWAYRWHGDPDIDGGDKEDGE